MYVFMHGTCQNGAAISISVQVQGPAQAPIVLPILRHCDLPQSRVPPLLKCHLRWVGAPPGNMHVPFSALFDGAWAGG